MTNMVNRKPYRTKAQKELARKNAYRGEDGAWHAATPFMVRDNDGRAKEITPRDYRKREAQ